MNLINTTQADIEHIAANMREDDVKEIMASSGMKPKECLELSVSISCYAKTIKVDDEPIAIAGFVVRDGIGIPWLLGTDAVLTKQKSFLKGARLAVDEAAKIAPNMVNYVHCDNKKSIRFLRRLGFEILNAIPFGISGEQFYQFQRSPECVTQYH